MSGFDTRFPSMKDKVVGLYDDWQRGKPRPSTTRSAPQPPSKEARIAARLASEELQHRIDRGEFPGVFPVRNERGDVVSKDNLWFGANSATPRRID